MSGGWTRLSAQALEPCQALGAPLHTAFGENSFWISVGSGSIPPVYELVASSAGGAVLALATAWSGYAFGARQEREKERRGRCLTAAQELVAPLRILQRLIRRFGREDVAHEEVAGAFQDWFAAHDSHAHRLPQEWRHLNRSIRDATGTVFGGVSFVDIRPDARDLDLAEPDHMWQDYADEYLEYVAKSILRWGDSSKDAPKLLMTYEEWLVRTGRREPWGTEKASGAQSPALATRTERPQGHA